MRKILASLVAAAVFDLFNTLAFATVNDDQVTSQKIKEADGTSGQNTNSGSGVKTNHIQNGAVTDPKISGPISASKIQNGVFQKKYANVIIVAKSGGDFSDPIAAIASITTASATNPYLVKIMPGVYDLGTTGLSLPSFVELEGSGKIATKLIGSANCNPSSALRSLSIENPSGGGLTVNSADVRNVSVKAKDVGIAAYGNATISSSDVEASRLNSLESVGIFVASTPASQRVTLTDVTALATGTNGGTDGYAIHNFYGSVTMNNVTAIASASPSVTNWAVYSIGAIETVISNSTLKAVGHYNQYGITNLYGSTTTVSNSKIITEDPAGGGSNVGLFINDGVMKIDYSEVKGSRSVLNQPGGSTFISYSKLDGGPMYSGEPYPAVGVKCIGNYTGDYSPYTCP